MAVKKLRMNEAVNTFYRINWGGNWNHGSEIFYSESELINFLSTHIFDTKPKIEKVEKINNIKYAKYLSYSYDDDITNILTDRARKELFDRGITSINNLKDSDNID